MITELIIALTVYLEAEGESFKGKQAVASVIHNRAKACSTHVLSVVFKPRQFSCYDDKRYVIKRLLKFNATQYAYSVLAVFSKDITNGSTHYSTIKTRKVWMKDMVRTMTIGKHKFMKLRQVKSNSPKQ